MDWCIVHAMADGSVAIERPYDGGRAFVKDIFTQRRGEWDELLHPAGAAIPFKPELLAQAIGVKAASIPGDPESAEADALRAALVRIGIKKGLIESDEAMAARLLKRSPGQEPGDQPRVIRSFVCAQEALPGARQVGAKWVCGHPGYRAAWRCIASAGAGRQGLAVDMTAAREIHRERLRTLRAPKLEALDVAYMRADEEGVTGETTKRALAAEKQRLRDAPADPAIEAAATLDELAAIGIDPSTGSG